MKDEIVRDEGPDRVDLGRGCSGEDGRLEAPVEEGEECRVLHAVIKCQLLLYIVQCLGL